MNTASDEKIQICLSLTLQKVFKLSKISKILTNLWLSLTLNPSSNSFPSHTSQLTGTLASGKIKQKNVRISLMTQLQYSIFSI